MPLNLGLEGIHKVWLDKTVAVIKAEMKLGETIAHELTALSFLIDLLSTYSIDVIFAHRDYASQKQREFASHCQEIVRIFNGFKESKEEPDEIKDSWKPAPHVMSINNEIVCRAVHYLFAQNEDQSIGEQIYAVTVKMLELQTFYSLLNLPQFLEWVQRKKQLQPAQFIGQEPEDVLNFKAALKRGRELSRKELLAARP